MATLVLIVILTQIRRARMSKKLEKSKSRACVAKRSVPKLVSIIAHFFETGWAVGASVAAAMVISLPTH
jgi:hypothetical protein